MPKLLVLLFVLCSCALFAQQNKIEIYLVKNMPVQQGMQGYFKLQKEDLELRPFIGDAEIKSVLVKKDTMRMPVYLASAKDDLDDSVFETLHSKKNEADTVTTTVIQEKQFIIIDSLSSYKLKNLHPPLREGIRFAVVVNDQIIYGGYFWNFVSSFGCNWVTAFAGASGIMVLRKLPDYWASTKENDPRQNELLFNCLRKTNRLRN